MGSQPRKRLNPDVLYPRMPEHVRREIVDLIAEAIVADMQENQGVTSIMVEPRRGNHHKQLTEEAPPKNRKTPRPRLRLHEE